MVGEPILVMLIEDNVDHAELVIRTLEEHQIANKVCHFSTLTRTLYTTLITTRQKVRLRYLVAGGWYRASICPKDIFVGERASYLFPEVMRITVKVTPQYPYAECSVVSSILLVKENHNDESCPSPWLWQSRRSRL